MDVDFDLCGGIYPIRAQDITASYATGRRAAVRSTCIRRRYVEHRHTTTTGAADNALPERREGAARPGYHCTSSLRTASA
ncbi:MAG: hypothetical protein QT04_C0006G0012 [archaeon GW2011_AR11]|nr:MAG: hypothetical protein QT04_C0006G0012 [archaeon GW2011_AR11]